MFLVFLNYFDELMSKIIFKNKKISLNMYFNTKNYLKNNYNHTTRNIRETACAHDRGQLKPKSSVFDVLAVSVEGSSITSSDVQRNS